jgi:predicted extracellular nuclease
VKTLNYRKFRENFIALSLGVLFVLAGQPADAQTIVPVNQIQGAGLLSPLVGKPVVTRGVVTAIVSRGFYIQTPDAEADQNPKTSEGIYVFTNEEKPAGVALGDLVEVSGTVTEYRPQAERYAFTLTELTLPTVKVVSQNNPLPAPALLTSAELSPKGNIDQMESFEGMRVKLDVLNVVAPTGGYTDRKTGEHRSDGVFWGVAAGVSRPMREAGIDGMIWYMDKLPQTTPVFDLNPELLRVDSDAQAGAKPIDVTSGAVLRNVTGVIDYAFRAYTLLIDAANPPVVEGNKTFVPASAAGEREVTVGSFNLENFFDDERNSDNVRNETLVSKEEFQRRLNKASLAIRNVLSMPDVLGVIEVENLKVLKKLADKINADAVAAGQGNPQYEAFLEEGNDIRGIDSGYLVKTSKVKVVKTELLAKNENFEVGAGDDAKLFDRPPFLISVEVADSKTAQPLAFTAIVNHFKSYRGIDDEKNGERVRQKRRLEAEWLANFVVQRQAANPAELLILVGDFNAFQFNDGYNDLIGILKGTPNPNELAPSKNVYPTGMINLIDFIEPAKRYSYIFGGSAQALDHILINKAAQARALKFGYARLAADFPDVYRNAAARPERLSDHDAPIVYLSLDEIQKPKPTPNP